MISKCWPHAPLHRLVGKGAFIVTAGTLSKEHFFRDAESWMTSTSLECGDSSPLWISLNRIGRINVGFHGNTDTQEKLRRVVALQNACRKTRTRRILVEKAFMEGSPFTLRTTTAEGPVLSHFHCFNASSISA